MLSFKLNNESGMAMIVAMVVTLIGTLIASSYMETVIHESRRSTRQKQSKQLLFLSEAGVEKSRYFLNNRDDLENPWLDGYGQMLDTPLEYTGYLAECRYEIILYDHNQISGLPLDQYLVQSIGTIPKPDGDEMSHTIRCSLAKLDALPIPAALSIFDDGDPEDEILNLQMVSWTIDGRDFGDPLGRGLYGIAVANIGDGVDTQLGTELAQITGADEWGNLLEAGGAISEDPDLPRDLDAYANYFREFAMDISGSGTIPIDLLGTENDYQILYADLNEGDLSLASIDTGYGILVLDGFGEFEMSGSSTWNGIIVGAGDSRISVRGYGDGVHIYGAILIANGAMEMDGIAHLQYSSENISRASQSFLYQVYSWCGDWGIPPSPENYPEQ